MEIEPNIISDSGLEVFYNGVTRIERARRVVRIIDLDDGTPTAAGTMFSRAVDIAEKAYPAYSRYPGARSAAVNGYSSSPVPKAVDAVDVTITFETLTNNGQAGELVIEDDTYTVADTTEILRNDVPGANRKIQQIILMYQDPKDPKIFHPSVGSVSFEKTMRRVVLSGIVTAAQIEPFRTAVNSVNKEEFLGLPPAFWRVTDLHDPTYDLGKTYKMQISLSADKERDWSKYVVGKFLNNGRVIQVRQNTLKGLQDQEYNPDTGILCPGKVAPEKNTSGVVRVCPYGFSDFTALFGKR